MSGIRTEIDTRPATNGSFVQPKASCRVYIKYKTALIAEPTINMLRTEAAFATTMKAKPANDNLISRPDRQGE
jgi:hypothetical protein